MSDLGVIVISRSCGIEFNPPRFRASNLGSLFHYISKFCIVLDSSMEPDREEESGEMYSPNESGEYTLCSDMPNFTVRGLQDALKETEATVTEPSPLAEEFIIQLEVTMAD